jgi:hypothetical protein
MITTLITAVSTYWTSMLLDGFETYKTIKAEVGKTSPPPDAGKVAIALAKAGVQEVERYWTTWGDIMTPAAGTVLLRVTSASVSASTTPPVFPQISSGELVPPTTGIGLTALHGAGSGTLKAKVEGFDRIKVTVDNLTNLAKDDVYVGFVYRKLASGDTRPLANVYVLVVS